MLGLDVSRCKTPQMIRKELSVGLLVYNLIRQTMLQAAIAADVSPRSLSFTAAMQTLAVAGIVAALDVGDLSLLVHMKLEHIASHRVGHRPGRVEPRAIKRRPKPHKLLAEPRSFARAKLLMQKSPYTQAKQSAVPFRSDRIN